MFRVFASITLLLSHWVTSFPRQQRQRRKGTSVRDKGVAGSLPYSQGFTPLEGKLVTWQTHQERKLMTFFPACASLSAGTQI